MAKKSNQFIGNQATPTILKNDSNIGIDTKNTLADNVISAGLSGGLNTNTLESFTSISNARDQLYNLIDTMALDSTVSAILRTYSEDVCEPADNGHVMWCESNDPSISKYVNYILNIMNVDKNMFGWAYSLLKYGDLYLKLFRESDFEDDFFNKSAIGKKQALNEDYFNNKFDKPDAQLEESLNLSIHSNTDEYSYYLESVSDPGSMFELTKFGKTYGYIQVPFNDTGISALSQYLVSSTAASIQNYRMRSSDITIYQADDFVHATLDDSVTRFPETVEIFNGSSDTKATAYKVRRGKSILYDTYKVWREKSLLESAVLLNRVTKSSVVRAIQVEVGDMSKEQSALILRRIKELIEQKSALNVNANTAAASMSEYTNPGPIENNIYLATHNNKGSLSINSIGGDYDPKQLTDLEWWNDRFFAAYGIPKQFFGYTGDGAGFNGGSSLTILSSVYAKGVKRVQNALIQAITDAVSLILLNKGYKRYLNNFTLKMKTPVTQEEKDYRTAISDQIRFVSDLNGLFNEIEDKERRLTILKTLVSTLNYSDSLTTEIDNEIKDIRAAKKAGSEQVVQQPNDLNNYNNIDAYNNQQDFDNNIASADNIADNTLSATADAELPDFNSIDFSALSRVTTESVKKDNDKKAINESIDNYLPTLNELETK